MGCAEERPCLVPVLGHSTVTAKWASPSSGKNPHALPLMASRPSKEVTASLTQLVRGSSASHRLTVSYVTLLKWVGALLPSRGFVRASNVRESLLSSRHQKPDLTHIGGPSAALRHLAKRVCPRVSSSGEASSCQSTSLHWHKQLGALRCAKVRDAAAASRETRKRIINTERITCSPSAAVEPVF